MLVLALCTENSFEIDRKTYQVSEILALEDKQSIRNVQTTCTSNYDFDHLALNLQWAPGYCRTSDKECTGTIKPEFTIHGMWPVSKGGQNYIQDCCFENIYRKNALNFMLNDMNMHWPSVHERPGKFWAHEWLKHGTCAKNVAALRGQEKYFQKTISIFKQLRIVEALNRANIRPGNGPIKYSAFVGALKAIHGNKSVQVGCNLEPKQPVAVLTDVSFCFGADLKPTNCKSSPSYCTRTLLIPDIRRQTFIAAKPPTVAAWGRAGSRVTTASRLLFYPPPIAVAS